MNEQNEAQQFEVLDESSALDTISRAEFDVQISTAKKYPRNLVDVKKGMLSFATLDEETAESCFYTLPRGGKSIQGPSVRLAEIAVSCYGNLRAGSRVISTVTTGETPHVVVQSVCHDLERNVAISIEKRRRIIGKKKNDGRIDEDDINLACNSCAAIAFRDAVFKVIPGALIRPVFEQAKKVAIGDASTLANRRVLAIEKFAKMGVTKDRVLVSLNKKSVEEIDLSDLETLVGLYTAIKDGQTSIDEAFPTKAAATPEFKKETSDAGKAALTADDLPMGEVKPTATEPEKPKAKRSPTPHSVATGPANQQEKPAPPVQPDNHVENSVELITRMMTDGGVTFDDFRDAVKASNSMLDTSSWASFGDIPEVIADNLAKNVAWMAKTLKTFGTKK